MLSSPTQGLCKNLKGAAVLKLLAGEDETLLVWRDSFLVLDLSLDGINGVAGLNLEGDGLACKRFHEDLHVAAYCWARAQTCKKLHELLGILLLLCFTPDDRCVGWVWGNNVAEQDRDHNDDALVPSKPAKRPKCPSG